MTGGVGGGDWQVKRVENFLRRKNDQIEKQKENKKRREGRLISASLLSCFFGQLPDRRNCRGENPTLMR